MLSFSPIPRFPVPTDIMSTEEHINMKATAFSCIKDMKPMRIRQISTITDMTITLLRSSTIIIITCFTIPNKKNEQKGF